jgi:iron(III) transport system ATP-binding protein
VQLDGFGSRPATKLSGGQQQRVALARALVAEPKVILFDEPLSNLDAKLREETRKELRRFLTELAITAVYVTHDRLEALSLSDSVAVMKSGKIIEMGSPWEIYFDSDRRFVADFIGRVNFVEGTTAEGGGDFTLVNSVIGPIACEKKKDYSPGLKATVGIRPEFIKTFRDNPGEGENTFRGRIETLVFLGDVWEAETQVGDATLVVRIDPALPVAVGDAIFLQMDRRYCSILLN